MNDMMHDTTRSNAWSYNEWHRAFMHMNVSFIWHDLFIHTPKSRDLFRCVKRVIHLTWLVHSQECNNYTWMIEWCYSYMMNDIHIWWMMLFIYNEWHHAFMHISAITIHVNERAMLFIYHEWQDSFIHMSARTTCESYSWPIQMCETC